MPDKKEEDELVTLIEVDNPVRADLIRSILQGSGISSFVPEESFGLTYAGVLGMKIQVRAADLERAREILEAEGDGGFVQ